MDYYDPSRQRIRVSLGPISKRDAEAIHAKQIVSMKEGKYFDSQVTKDWAFNDAINDYLSYSRLHKKSWRSDALKSRPLLLFFGKKNISYITSSEIERYKRLRLLSVVESTVNRELALLKTIFARLNRDGRYNKNPAKPVKLLSEQHLKRDRIINHDEWLRLVGASPDLLKHLLIVAYYTAMRKGEILGLTWNQVDLNHCVITLSASVTKTKKPRVIPLTVEVHSILQDRKGLANGPWVFHRNGRRLINMDKLWKRACRQANIDDLRFHDLRHSAITRLIKAGIPEQAIMALSGHSTRSVFDRYVNLKTDDIRQYLNAAATHSHNLVTVKNNNADSNEKDQ